MVKLKYFSFQVPVQKDVQVTVVGKVFKPNRLNVLALNRTLVNISGL